MFARNDVANNTSAARSRHTTGDFENADARSVLTAWCSAVVVRRWRTHNAIDSTTAAASDVVPSTMNKSGNDTPARNPPTAGPTLMARLTDRRLSAIAARRFSGAADPVNAAIVAGRPASETIAQTNTRTSTV